MKLYVIVANVDNKLYAVGWNRSKGEKENVVCDPSEFVYGRAGVSLYRETDIANGDVMFHSSLSDAEWKASSFFQVCDGSGGWYTYDYCIFYIGNERHKVFRKDMFIKEFTFEITNIKDCSCKWY